MQVHFISHFASSLSELGLTKQMLLQALDGEPFDIRPTDLGASRGGSASPNPGVKSLQTRLITQSDHDALLSRSPVPAFVLLSDHPPIEPRCLARQTLLAGKTTKTMLRSPEPNFIELQTYHIIKRVGVFPTLHAFPLQQETQTMGSRLLAWESCADHLLCPTRWYCSDP